jgi:hypothetical protein
MSFLQVSFSVILHIFPSYLTLPADITLTASSSLYT